GYMGSVGLLEGRYHQSIAANQSMATHQSDQGLPVHYRVQSTQPQTPSRHKSDKQHICQLCRKTFQSPYKLERHLKVHTGEKPFKCSFCNKAFGRKDNLKQHENLHRK
ncbi:unnamed protein product, partial [Owenia fusiformis]